MGKIRNWLSSIFGAVSTSTQNPAQWFLDWSSGGQPSDAGIAVNESTAMRSSAVYASVSIIAQSIASLPFGVVRKDGNDRIPDPDNRVHSIIHDSPNEFMTPIVFWELLMCNLLLSGNGYARIERTRGLEPLSLLPIHPSRVAPERSNGQTRYRVSLVDGGEEVVQSADMIHIPGLGFDGLVGNSVIQFAAKNSIGLSLVMQQHASKSFANGTKLSGLLKTKHPMSNDTKTRFLEHWRRYMGAENTGGTPILEQDMDFTPISMSSVDAQLMEMMRLSIEDISRFFRVPLHMINETSKSTSWGSGLEQLTIGFVQYTLRSWLVRIEQEINRKLLFDRLGLPTDRSSKFELDGLLRGDSTARAAFYASAIQNGWMTPNEARSLEDLPPDENGGQLFMQGAMVPLSTLVNPETIGVENEV